MKKKLLFGLTIGLIFGLIFVSGANASLVFSDDFEDGNVLGWQETVVSGQGGSGSTGVESHNSSQMAFVYHQGEGEHSLSQDFGYVADNMLSFDMQAVATLGSTYTGSPLHSQTGVVISFLNFLNSPLGSLSLVNATNSSLSIVDNSFHNYVGSMGTFATAAGLSAGDSSITKISLEFFATADYSWGGNIYPNGISSAKVWFDNVAINDSSPVPVPGAIWLFGSGLVGLVRLRRKKQS